MTTVTPLRRDDGPLVLPAAIVAGATMHRPHLASTFLRRRVWNGIFAAGDWRTKRGLKAMSPRRDRKSETNAHGNGRKNGLSACELSVAGFAGLGGGGCSPAKPVSKSNSLLTGKITGNFLAFGRFEQDAAIRKPRGQGASRGKRQKNYQGNFAPVTGIKFAISAYPIDIRPTLWWTIGRHPVNGRFEELV
jgi:hypothetical protein